MPNVCNQTVTRPGALPGIGFAATGGPSVTSPAPAPFAAASVPGCGLGRAEPSPVGNCASKLLSPATYRERQPLLHPEYRTLPDRRRVPGAAAPSRPAGPAAWLW